VKEARAEVSESGHATFIRRRRAGRERNIPQLHVAGWIAAAAALAATTFRLVDDHGADPSGSAPLRDAARPADRAAAGDGSILYLNTDTSVEVEFDERGRKLAAGNG
jgi:ferric-dicitrate binding protein FerR (iron transport regulator)